MLHKNLELGQRPKSKTMLVSLKFKGDTKTLRKIQQFLEQDINNDLEENKANARLTHAKIKIM